MKTKLITLFAAGILFSIGSSAQNYRVKATNYDISDNLDLEAVSYIFGESSNLEDFEARLNDPDTQISNLDLNNDGYVDYLRVVELYENNIHLVTIQAVLDRDIFQDVATIDVGRNNGNNMYVQVVGDPYLYGPNYIIEPVFVRPPVIFSWFLGAAYVAWHSPFYWGYYPPRYHRYHCMPTYRYHRDLHVHIDIHSHKYNYVHDRRNPRAYDMQHRVSRNDYGQRHPSNSFANRNKGYSNKHDMVSQRPGRTTTGNSRQSINKAGNTNNGRPGYSNGTQGNRSANNQNGNTQQKRSYENKSTRNSTGSSTYQRGTNRSATSTNSNSNSYGTNKSNGSRGTTTQPSNSQQKRSYDTTRSQRQTGNSGYQNQTQPASSAGSSGSVNRSQSSRQTQSSGTGSTVRQSNRESRQAVSGTSTRQVTRQNATTQRAATKSTKKAERGTSR